MNTLLKFGASYCAPCRVIVPIIESLKDSINVMEYDTDECDEELLHKYNVRNIPLLVIENEKGEILWRHVGVITKSDLERKIDELNY